MKEKETIESLIQERKQLERIIQKSSPMVAAAYCVRNSTVSRGFAYLSASIEGKARHRYVKKGDQKEWKTLAKEWRLFSESIARWVILGKDLERQYRSLGEKRCVALPVLKRRTKKL